MTVYLLHIDPPLRHSRHYIGFTRFDDVDERVKRHQQGTGGVLPREAVRNGSTISLAHVWPGKEREFEKRLKRYGGMTRYCPLCKGKRTLPK